MNKIYIVLTHTGTILSRIIRLFTKNEYTHASIALEKEINPMYSFGRLNPYNPFWGGFVEESIYTGTFKRFKNTQTEIYSFEVSNESYRKLKELIAYVNENREIYKFNIKGLIYAFFHKSCIRKNKFYCSEFVKYILEKSNIQIKGLSDVIKPEEFRKLEEFKLEYKGLLRLYKSTDKRIK